MKRVVNKSMVAHLFAHQAQPEARTASGNFYFHGDTCWSYGSHYCAAVHHGEFVLINSHRYSVTTASQLSELRQACRHLRYFEVPNPQARTKPEHRENFRYLVRQYEDEIDRLTRARVHNSPDHAEGMLHDANDYARFTRIGNRLKPIAPDQIGERIKTRTAKERADSLKLRRDAEKRAAAEREKMKAEYTVRLDEWRNGLTNYLNFWRFQDTARLRLTSDGSTVQTSRGVEFPADDARAALPFVLEVLDSGRSWQRNGQQIPLGPFQLDRIDCKSQTVKAGCHTVTANEVRRLAGLLNYSEVAA